MDDHLISAFNIELRDEEGEIILKTRLNRITTTTGDDGTSALADGARLPKSSPVFELLGQIDELNVAIGFVLLHCQHQELTDKLNWLQHKLFDVGASISLRTPQNTATSSKQFIAECDLVPIQIWIKELNQSLPPLQEFLLPNGGSLSLGLHNARVRCRKVERVLCTWHQQCPQNPWVLKFVNRLSDLFFIMARIATENEQIWSPSEETS